MAKITRIAIENFKGIRDSIELDLKPITLLFGANSAGKSSILHAMHYAREIFMRRNLDPDLPVSGGSSIDLGGFRQLVHRNDLSLRVRLTFTLDMTDTQLPEFFPPPPDYEDQPYPESLVGDVQEATVSTVIGWNEWDDSPFVEEYEVSLNGDIVARADIEAGRKGVNLTLYPVQTVFPSQNSLSRYGQAFDLGDVDTPAFFLVCTKLIEEEALPQFSSIGEELILSVPIGGQKDALPEWDSIVSIELEPAEYRDDNGGFEFLRQWFLETVSQVLAGPGQLLRDTLESFRFLGPLRETPSRDHAPPRFADPSRWASGLGAWDTLQRSEYRFVDLVSDWLGGEDQLDSGYHLRLKRYKELDLSDPLVAQLISGRAVHDWDGETKLKLNEMPTHSRLEIVPSNQKDMALQPHDVGIGISQVVPVIVTALDGKNRLLAIEQPELHLHPKMQARLADLFVDSALSGRENFLILETHSELIPLRLMRRIRETADGTLPPGRTAITAQDVAINYIESYESATICTHLELGDRGQLLDPWPEGFFEEGFRERFSE